MKNKRTIIIKDLHLRKIRNNLRNIVIIASSREKFKALNTENSDESKFWEIEQPLRASILLCSVCFKSDKDMTYNPKRKIWYCRECYEKLRIGNQK